MRWAIRPERLDVATKEMRAVADRWDRRLRAIKEIAEAIHAEQKQKRNDESTKERAR